MTIPVVTTDTLEGYKTSGVGKLLSTTVAANMKDYYASDSEKIENAKEQAIDSLRAKAAEQDLNAIVGLNIELFRADDGRFFSYLVTAYATGVKVVAREG